MYVLYVCYRGGRATRALYMLARPSAAASARAQTRRVGCVLCALNELRACGWVYERS